MDTEGVSGERVIDSMKNRLGTILSKQKYNWIIILGGTHSHATNGMFRILPKPHVYVSFICYNIYLFSVLSINYYHINGYQMTPSL